MMFNNKKGMITNPFQAFMIFFIVGLIIGVVVMFLAAKGVLPVFNICA
ncbi:MAG: hypothetical protein ACOCZV_02415 [Nanoarchaeota archaeon]